MALDDRQDHRDAFRVRIKRIERRIEDLRDEILVAQQHKPLPPTSTHLGWTDFHLVSAVEELVLASEAIAKI